MCNDCIPVFFKDIETEKSKVEREKEDALYDAFMKKNLCTEKEKLE